jgi:predicted nucleotidyltransferase
LPLSEAHRREIASLCERYSVQHLALFGSAAHGDFDPARSDVDVTVQFRRVPDSASATHYFDLKQGLESVFGRPVDLVELDSMPDSRLKRQIERTQVPICGEPKAA